MNCCYEDCHQFPRPATWEVSLRAGNLEYESIGPSCGPCLEYMVQIAALRLQEDGTLQLWSITVTPVGR